MPKVWVETGTILMRNYTERNPNFASIPVVITRDLIDRETEGLEMAEIEAAQDSLIDQIATELVTDPTVLFFGIQNENSLFIVPINHYAGVIWEDGSRGKGCYALVRDRGKKLLNKNYKLKFLR